MRLNSTETLELCKDASGANLLMVTEEKAVNNVTI